MMGLLIIIYVGMERLELYQIRPETAQLSLRTSRRGYLPHGNKIGTRTLYYLLFTKINPLKINTFIIGTIVTDANIYLSTYKNLGIPALIVQIVNVNAETLL